MNVSVRGRKVEVVGGPGATIAASHPGEPFGEAAASLLEATAGRPAVCLNPPGVRGGAQTLEEMVDDLEGARRALGAAPWVFWGMSGGGWLALLYARRHPEALAGIIVESACPCFRERVADPACLMSPFHPAWRPVLAEAGLLAETALDAPIDGPTAWVEVAGVGSVLRRADGPALLASPMPLTPLMRQMMPAFLRFDARPWLAELRVPALVVAGSADPVVPLPHARAVHQALPGSRFLAVDGAGHVPTGERRPEVQAAVRAFLAERVLATGAPPAT
jgi:3-oxoadipate enol-lactonase